jgi:hypothetical protein
MWGTSANCNGIATDRGEPGEHCDAVPADVRYSVWNTVCCLAQ